MLHKSGCMFGNHIASALARERQSDLVPELRGLERERSAFGIEDGEPAGVRAVGPGSKLASRARSRFGRAAARRAMGRRQTGQEAS